MLYCGLPDTELQQYLEQMQNGDLGHIFYVEEAALLLRGDILGQAARQWRFLPVGLLLIRWSYPEVICKSDRESLRVQIFVSENVMPELVFIFTPD